MFTPRLQEKEIRRLKNALCVEREHFKKAKKWLKAEMQSRVATPFSSLPRPFFVFSQEEMDGLLRSLKHAIGPSADRGKDLEEGVPNGIEADSEMQHLQDLLKLRQARLNEDGKSLQAQIHSTKRKVAKALTSKCNR